MLLEIVLFYSPNGELQSIAEQRSARLSWNACGWCVIWWIHLLDALFIKKK